MIVFRVRTKLRIMLTVQIKPVKSLEAVIQMKVETENRKQTETHVRRKKILKLST